MGSPLERPESLPPLRLGPQLSDALGPKQLEQLSTVVSGGLLSPANKDQLLAIVHQLTHSDKQVRQQAVEVLAAEYQHQKDASRLPLSGAIFDTSGLTVVKGMIPRLQADVQDEKNCGLVLDIWDILVQLLGTHLHTGLEMINPLMTVIEKAFKAKLPSGLPCPVVIERTFKSWMVLMDNFALQPEVLNADRRVKLLVRPLTHNNSRQESTIRAKLECWWHLMEQLGTNLPHHSTDVVQPFVSFCYGPKAAQTAADRAISPVNGGRVASPAGTPMSPAKRFPGLARLCLEALAALLAPHSHSLLTSAQPFSLPRLQFTPRTTPAITPGQLSTMAPILFTALQDITESLKPSSMTDRLCVLGVWRGVSGLLKELVSLPNHLPALNLYLRTLKHAFLAHRRQTRLQSFLFDLLNLALSLPASSLLSLTYQDTAHSPVMTPLHLLFSLLMQDNLLNSLEDHKVLVATAENAACQLTEPGQLEDLVHRMELTAENLTTSGLEQLSLVWQAVARSVSNWSELAEIKEGGQQRSFQCVIQFLRVPLQQLADKGWEATFWRAWEQLYSALCAQGEVAVGHSSGHICGDLTSKLITIYRSRSKASAGFVYSQARAVQIMTEGLIFSSLARQLAAQSVIAFPLAGFKKQLEPLGPVTPIILHLNVLTDAALTLDPSPSEVLECLLAAYTRIYTQATQPELMRQVIKLTLPTIALFFREKNLQKLESGGLHGVLEKLFLSVAAMLDTKYNGPFDKQLLDDCEEFVSACFASKRPPVQARIQRLWNLTFGALPRDQLPADLRDLLKLANSTGIRKQAASSSDSLSNGETNSFPSSELIGAVSVEPAIEAALGKGPGKPGSPYKKASGAVVISAVGSPKPTRSGAAVSSPKPGGLSAATKTAATSSPKMKPPSLLSSSASKAKAKPQLRLEDEDSCNFVPIKSVQKKRLLTEHQKDVLTSRHDDIPALYSELSRDDSHIQLPSQFLSQSSFCEDSTDRSCPPGDGKSATIKEVKEVEERTTSPGSQSLLSKMKAADLKQRKNARVETRGVKRPAGSPDTEEGGVAKKTRRQISRAIFGDSSSQEEEEEEDKSADSSVQILDEPENKVVETLTIATSSEDSVKGAEISRKSANTSEDVSSNTSEQPADAGHEEEILESSQKPAEQDQPKGRARRERRSTAGLTKRFEDCVTASAAPSTTAKVVVPAKKKVPPPAVLKRNAVGETPLHQAAKKGEVGRVRDLLRQGADPNVADNAGWYPLHEAVLSDKPDALKIVNLLIKSGSLVDCVACSVTPLHEAVQAGKEAIVKCLLQAGADPGHRNEAGESVHDIGRSNPVLAHLFPAPHPSSQTTEKAVMAPVAISEGRRKSRRQMGAVAAAVVPQLSVPETDSEHSGDEEGELPSNKEESIETEETHQPAAAAGEESINSDCNIGGEAAGGKEEATCPLVNNDPATDHLSAADEPKPAESADHKPCDDDPMVELKSADAPMADLQPVDVLPPAADSVLVGVDSSVTDVPPNPANAVLVPDSNNALETLVASAMLASAMDTNISCVDDEPAAAMDTSTCDEAALTVEDEASIANKENQSCSPNVSQQMFTISGKLPSGGKLLTVVNEKVRTTAGKGSSSSSKGAATSMNSRGAMLLNLSRKKSLDSNRPSSASSGEGSPSLLSSPKLASRLSTANPAPWQKYNPSPSHASPSAGILKRKSIDDSISSTEGSPVSAKHVHFNENPVSDRVEIPRFSDGNHTTRKKLRMSGLEQEAMISSLMLDRKKDDEESQDSGEEEEEYQGTPPLNISTDAICPELVACELAVSEIVHLIVCSSTWLKVLESNLKENNIKTIGDLARMEPAYIRNLKGVKPVNDVTVRTVLKSYHARLRKEGRWTEPNTCSSKWISAAAPRTQRAPVEEVTSQEEEEKIKEAIFLSCSPSPTKQREQNTTTTSCPSPSKSATASQDDVAEVANLGVEPAGPSEEAVAHSLEDTVTPDDTGSQVSGSMVEVSHHQSMYIEQEEEYCHQELGENSNGPGAAEVADNHSQASETEMDVVEEEQEEDEVVSEQRREDPEPAVAKDNWTETAATEEPRPAINSVTAAVVTSALEEQPGTSNLATATTETEAVVSSSLEEHTGTGNLATVAEPGAAEEESSAAAVKTTRAVSASEGAEQLLGLSAAALAALGREALVAAVGSVHGEQRQLAARQEALAELMARLCTALATL